jgi:hypothetical protein
MTLTMFFLREISPIWLNLKFLKENLAKFIHIFNKNKIKIVAYFMIIILNIFILFV